MLKIRLKRVGKKNDSAFRIIVTPAGQSITSGKYLDQIGFYDPRSNKKEIDADKATKWISNGAQPTGTVYNLLVDAGVIKGQKKNVLPQKSPVVGESTTTEEVTDSTPAQTAEDRASVESETETSAEATADESADNGAAEDNAAKETNSAPAEEPTEESGDTEVTDKAEGDSEDK